MNRLVKSSTHKRRWHMLGVSRLSRGVAALALVGVGIAGGRAAGQCNSFTVIQSSGSVVPGDADTGNHGDDWISTISLPFSWSLYGVPYSGATVSSNGNVQFTTSSTAYNNGCLTAGTMGVMIAAHWDDLMTDDGGIYTSVSGSAPNRIFNIEWRAGLYPSPTVVLNFEVRLYE